MSVDTRGSGSALATAPSRYVTSSRVAHTRSGSPSKSVSVVPTSEKSRHGMTKIMRSSSADRYTARSVILGRRQWMPLVVRSTRGRPPATPAMPRTRSAHGPAQFTMTRAATAWPCPLRRSRTPIRTVPSRSRATPSTSQ